MTLIERIHFGDNKKRGRERRYRHRRIFFGKAPFLFRLLRRCELNNAIEFQLNYIQIITVFTDLSGMKRIARQTVLPR